MFALTNLSAQEKLALFGEPTKSATKILKKINPMQDNGQNDYKENDQNNDGVVAEQLFVDFFTKKQGKNKNKTTKDKIHDFFQRLVIPFNNSYKFAWDFCLLIIISYNCVIICY